MAGFLLDTHSLLWFLDGNPRMSIPAREAVGDLTSNVFVSAASAWEIATKFRIGKLPAAGAIASRVPETVLDKGFAALDITMQHAQLAGALPGAHKDPFDRMLAAQALLDGLVLVSNDTVFDRFGVKRLW